MKELQLGNVGGRIIQFLHANAYPPGCYHQFLSSLSDFDIRLPYQRPMWDGADANSFKSWRQFSVDIEQHMSEKSLHQVIGMGHSMGGIVSLIAAHRNPERFSELILIDPVILPGMLVSVLSRLPYALTKKFLPIVEIAARRKNVWKDRQEAKTYLLSKKVFQRFDPQSLDDFVAFGLKETTDGVTLSFPREWESHIYATAPNIWSVLKKIKTPITIIKAQYSDVITSKVWEKIRRINPNAQLLEFPDAGHLMPFEQPQQLATVIKEVISNR